MIIPTGKSKIYTSHSAEKEKIYITGERAIELLREIVAEKGEDFRYTSPYGYGCNVYAHNGHPSCGVAHALFRAGVPIEDLERMDAFYGDVGISIFNAVKKILMFGARFRAEFEHLAENLSFVLTPQAVAILAVFQQQQDSGVEWGEALRKAEAVYEFHSTKGKHSG